MQDALLILMVLGLFTLVAAIRVIAVRLNELNRHLSTIARAIEARGSSVWRATYDRP